MSNRIDTRIVLGSLKYKTASDVDFMLNVPFNQTTKENVEFDRSININLGQLYDDERQSSTNFRPTCKFSMLFKNAYTGYSEYNLLENQLYYVDEYNDADLNCPPADVRWFGFPQYNEFDFIRNDYNVSGYTVPNSGGTVHVNFVTKSASTYNWNHFLSYPFENDYNKKLSAIDSITKQTLNWVASDGIPFVVYSSKIGGLGMISFRCPVKHNLTVGESVKLSFSYNGVNTFQIFSLGTGIPGSEFYTFNIMDIGFLGTTFSTGSIGTFKRVINPEISGETTSKYYVRRHKILTDVNDAVLVDAGFDENIFGQKKKYESSGLTPNHIARVSVREGAQSYTLSFNKDVDIDRIIDNQKRPISELFFTTIYKGYFGLMFGQNTSDGLISGLKQGYDFNLPLDESVTPNLPSPWWNINNTLSDTNFPLGYYYRSIGGFQKPLYYVESFKKGDVLDGDFCEWNDWEQKERVISEINHKLIYDPLMFNTITLSNNQTNFDLLENPFGYYYKPHNKLTIRGFSDYIETGSAKDVVGIPNYAYFSSSQNLFMWRDIYTYGFIDNKGNGVNYPFFNNTHYPYGGYEFRIIPEGTNYIESNLSYNASIYGTGQPIIDNCE
jgi:hypothetical protein